MRVVRVGATPALIIGPLRLRGVLRSLSPPAGRGCRANARRVRGPMRRGRRRWCGGRRTHGRMHDRARVFPIGWPACAAEAASARRRPASRPPARNGLRSDVFVADFRKRLALPLCLLSPERHDMRDAARELEIGILPPLRLFLRFHLLAALVRVRQHRLRHLRAQRHRLALVTHHGEREIARVRRRLGCPRPLAAVLLGGAIAAR